MSNLSLPTGLICVGFYEVSRCYGGPEEGGWWYDHYEHTHSAIIREDDLKSFQKAHSEGETVESYPMGSFFNGDLESPEMLGEAFGDVNLHIYVETYPGSKQTRECPHYE